MSDAFLCHRQERCPVVLGACERKVAAEARARIAESKVAMLEGRVAAFEQDSAAYEGKRSAMNELFAAGVAMRTAQKKYFADRTNKNLVTSKLAEERFDQALAACRNLGKPKQSTLSFDGGAK